DGSNWPAVSRQWQLTKLRRLPEHWRYLPWPDSPSRRAAEAALAQLRDLASLPFTDRAVFDHIAAHAGSRADAERQLRTLISHLGRDRDRCQTDKGRLLVARSGYGVEIDISRREVVGYTSSNQHQQYGDYLEFGRADEPLKKIPMTWKSSEDRLEISDLDGLRAMVDPATIFYSNRTFDQLAEPVRLDHVNSWDADRYIRYHIDADLSRAEPQGLRTLHGRFVLEVDNRTWIFAQDGLSVKLARATASGTGEASKVEERHRDSAEASPDDAEELDVPARQDEPADASSARDDEESPRS